MSGFILEKLTPQQFLKKIYRRRAGYLSNNVLEASNKLQPGEAFKLDPKMVNYGSLNTCINSLKKKDAISQDIFSVVRNQKDFKTIEIYLVRLTPKMNQDLHAHSYRGRRKYGRKTRPDSTNADTTAN